LTLQAPSGAFAQGVTVTATELLASQAPAPPEGDSTAVVWSFDTGGVEPSKPLTLTFTYDPSTLNGSEPQKLGVYLYNETTRKWQWVGGTVNTTNHTITVTVDHLSVYGAFVNTTTFNDLSGYAWATPAIDKLLGADMIQGLSAGVFDPAGNVTRAEFAKLLVEALGLPVDATSTAFTDVPSSAWYAPYVAAAQGAGLVKGQTATRFDPSAAISRQQMAAMLARALTLAGVSVQTRTYSFKDSAQISPSLLGDIATVVSAGLIAGFPDGTLRPTGVASRAEAAVMLARFLQAIGKA
jgi:hypothetical protein